MARAKSVAVFLYKQTHFKVEKMSITAFPWFGGKASPKIHKALLSLMPPHTRYVEPFGGGASILLNKTPAEVEVYNDVNRGAVNFFKVVSDVDLFARFLSRVSMLPVSRELFEEHARTWAGIHEPIEQAVRWYYVARQSFGGMFAHSWSSTVDSATRGMAQTAAAWQHALDALPEIHKRMQRVQIECSDWSTVLDRYSGPGWLAYCDPPYVLGARRAGGYEHELHDCDHVRMIKTLLTYNGAVMLSGYNTALYDPLQEAGWDIQRIDVVCSAAGHTRISGLQGAGSAKIHQRRVEVVWRNPVAMRRIKDSTTD